MRYIYNITNFTTVGPRYLEKIGAFETISAPLMYLRIKQRLKRIYGLAHNYTGKKKYAL